jgi:hypothetical protein
LLLLLDAEAAWLAAALRLELDDCALFRVSLALCVALLLSELLSVLEAELTSLVFKEPFRVEVLLLFF